MGTRNSKSSDEAPEKAEEQAANETDEITVGEEIELADEETVIDNDASETSFGENFGLRKASAQVAGHTHKNTPEKADFVTWNPSEQNAGSEVAFDQKASTGGSDVDEADEQHGHTTDDEADAQSGPDDEPDHILEEDSDAPAIIEDVEHFDGWKLHCGHSDKYEANANENTFHFETTTTTLRMSTPGINFFEVEILDFWSVDKFNKSGKIDTFNSHTQFFGFVTKEYKQNPDAEKKTIAESPFGWCVGFHKKAPLKISTFHHFGGPDGKSFEGGRPHWGATAPVTSIYKGYNIGDVIGCYYDQSEGQIWSGLNGDYRWNKGVAFHDVDKELFPAISFNNGSIRVLIEKKVEESFIGPRPRNFIESQVAVSVPFMFGPPTKEDRENHKQHCVKVLLPKKSLKWTSGRVRSLKGSKWKG